MAKQAKTTGRHGWLHYSCPDGLDGLNHPGEKGNSGLTLVSFQRNFEVGYQYHFSCFVFKLCCSDFSRDGVVETFLEVGFTLQ